jgi:hypothetical protein
MKTRAAAHRPSPTDGSWMSDDAPNPVDRARWDALKRLQRYGSIRKLAKLDLSLTPEQTRVLYDLIHDYTYDAIHVGTQSGIALANGVYNNEEAA